MEIDPLETTVNLNARNHLDSQLFAMAQRFGHASDPVVVGDGDGLHPQPPALLKNLPDGQLAVGTVPGVDMQIDGYHPLAPFAGPPGSGPEWHRPFLGF
jgi:hypothetical protein